MSLKDILLSGLIIGLTALPATAATVSTLPLETSFVQSWGLPDTSAYGQTITLGGAETLNSFSFRINDLGTAINFDAYVFGWDGDSTSGSALFSSNGVTVGASGMNTITINVGALPLLAGQYILFLQATSLGLAYWGTVTGDPYNGGSFAFQNNNGDPSKFGNNSWLVGNELAFSYTTDVTAVPVPAALPLLATGLGALGFAGWRSSKKDKLAA